MKEQEIKELQKKHDKETNPSLKKALDSKIKALTGNKEIKK